MYQRILVPVDGTSAKQAMLDEAIHLTQFCHESSLRLVHVVDVSAVAEVEREWGGASSVANVADAVRKNAQDILDDAAQKVKAAGLDTEAVLIEIQDGDLAAAVVEGAKKWDADLIVMGTHGHGGLYHLIMGSVAEGVVRQARVPVLLVPSQG